MVPEAEINRGGSTLGLNSQSPEIRQDSLTRGPGGWGEGGRNLKGGRGQDQSGLVDACWESVCKEPVVVRDWGILSELSSQAPILVGQDRDFPGPGLAPGIVGPGQSETGRFGAAESSRKGCELGRSRPVPTWSMHKPAVGVPGSGLKIECQELGWFGDKGGDRDMGKERDEERCGRIRALGPELGKQLWAWNLGLGCGGRVEGSGDKTWVLEGPWRRSAKDQGRSWGLRE